MDLRQEPRSSEAESEYPIFRLFVKALVNSTDFPEASNFRGHKYSDPDSALVARVKYLQQPVDALLAERVMEWAKKGISQEVCQAIKNALGWRIEEYLKKKDPKGFAAEEIQAAVLAMINASEEDVLKNIDRTNA